MCSRMEGWLLQRRYIHLKNLLMYLWIPSFWKSLKDTLLNLFNFYQVLLLFHFNEWNKLLVKSNKLRENAGFWIGYNYVTIGIQLLFKPTIIVIKCLKRSLNTEKSLTHVFTGVCVFNCIINYFFKMNINSHINLNFYLLIR